MPSQKVISLKQGFSNKSGLSVVIPVYNEEEILKKNIEKLVAALARLGCDYEVILSENGSTDSTREICKKLHSHNPLVRYIFSNVPSFGGAIRRGVKDVRYSRFMVFAADLWDLTFVKRAYKEALAKNYDVVFGARYLHKGVHKRPLIRKIISRSNTTLVNLIYGTKFNDVNAIKLYSAKIGRKLFQKTKDNGAFIEVEIALIIKNSKINYGEVFSSHIEPGTRHFKYVIKIIVSGIIMLFLNYGRLRKIRI